MRRASGRTIGWLPGFDEGTEPRRMPPGRACGEEPISESHHHGQRADDSSRRDGAQNRGSSILHVSPMPFSTRPLLSMEQPFSEGARKTWPHKSD
jgi:hypothetical protein